MNERDRILESMAASGYVFLRGAAVRGVLEQLGRLDDWTAFARSWNDLEVDRYLADRARFRRRRFGVYEAGRTGLFERQPHQPHYQPVEYNALFGGVERWFEPIRDAIAAGPTMQAVLALCRNVSGALAASVERWHIEVHQFRIEPRPGEPGYPTPEGVHRDGVDYVLVLLVNRCNIVSGTTTVHDLEGRQLGAFTLADPLDAAFVDDRRVAHGVTPVSPLDPALPAHRDVLVVTFRSMQPADRPDSSRLL